MRRCMGKVAYARSRTGAKRIPLKSSYGKFANSCWRDDERLASENNFARFQKRGGGKRRREKRTYYARSNWHPNAMLSAIDGLRVH